MKLKFVIDQSYDLEMGESKGYKEPFYSQVEKDYKKVNKTLIKTKELFQKVWDEINDDFSKYVEKETSYKWFYPEYKCVVSIAHLGGISNWGHSNKISFFWGTNPYLLTSGVAYELILAHYFKIIKKHYKEENLSDRQIWALGEVCALALTSLTKEAEKFWPWNHGYTTKHNHPQIITIQNKLKQPFLKRKNFDEYIKQGIKLVKKYPNMGPNGA